MYTVTKTYNSDRGLSASFRQHRAESHCRFLHGYALGFELTLGCDDTNLEENGWVYNFGGFKGLKTWLEETFDHKTVVAEDDPLLETFTRLAEAELIQLRVVERVGCEAFARMVYDKMHELLVIQNEQFRVFLLSVKCFEHSGNSATFHGRDISGRYL